MQRTCTVSAAVNGGSRPGKRLCDRMDYERECLNGRNDSYLQVFNPVSSSGDGGFKCIESVTKRHCHGLNHIQNLQKCNKEFSGALHFRRASGIPAENYVSCNGHFTNGFQNCEGHQNPANRGGGANPQVAPMISNGYYGYIAHYEHAGSDSEEAMELMPAEYAISGPATCVEPKERRVCSRCSAGEPGHITHIIRQ